MSAQHPTILILASGRGERFRASGGQGSKLLAEISGKAVLEHTLDAVRASGLPFHVETAPHHGMGDSIAAAVRATQDAVGWLVLPGDLPLVQPCTLLAVAQALAQHSVVVPVFQRQRGHPVGFAPLCRAALLSLKGNRGAAPVVNAYDATELIVNDEGIMLDIDTLEDLYRAARLFERGAL